MGSPLGPILSDFLMGLLEEQADQTIRTSAMFFGRYADDILVVTKDDKAVNDILHHLDAIDNNIRFTVEQEAESRLPFLDVMIYRGPSALSFGWYHKPTWTGQYLHALSFVPLSWKQSLLKGIKHRLVTICSKEHLSAAISQVSLALGRNGYSSAFIQKYFLSYNPRQQVGPTVRLLVPQKSVFVQLPFLGDWLSKCFTCRLNKAVQSVYPAARVIVRPFVTRAIVPITKDPLLSMSTPGVVYQFHCDCTEQYIGRTECRLEDRIKQHIPKWLEAGSKVRPRSKALPNSSITKHILSCDLYHSPRNNHFKILHKGRSKYLNSILEALHISIDRPRLCVQKEFVFHLNLPWT